MLAVNSSLVRSHRAMLPAPTSTAELATWTAAWSEPTPPSLSVIVTVTVYDPTAVYVCDFVIGAIVLVLPLSVVPSPQSNV